MSNVKFEFKEAPVGTLSWVEDELKNKSTLVIKEGRYHTPTMFLKTLVSKDESGKEKYRYDFICRKELPNESSDTSMECRFIGGNIVTNVYDTDHETGLFSCTLTEEGFNYAEKFIDDAVEKFNEWWENGGKLE